MCIRDRCQTCQWYRATSIRAVGERVVELAGRTGIETNRRRADRNTCRRRQAVEIPTDIPIDRDRSRGLTGLDIAAQRVPALVIRTACGRVEREPANLNEAYVGGYQIRKHFDLESLSARRRVVERTGEALLVQLDA